MAVNVLVCGVNWLGDSIMAMPALQEFKRRHPLSSITMLTRDRLTPLWEMHPAVARSIGYTASVTGTLKAARAVRAGHFRCAYIFANSFRSGLIPLLAGVPERSGVRGHRPDWLLSRVIPPGATSGHEHQLWEYFRIMELGEEDLVPENPHLSIPPAAMDEARRRVGPVDRLAVIGLVPGAARGPSKQWPEEHFAAAGRRLAETTGARLLVFGTREEAALCARVTAGIGPAATDLSGSTSLGGLAALLACCRVVIANDSGGMHLAAAVGSRVVAIFGRTDPVKTGPIGSGHRVMALSGVRRSRDIERDSREACEALRAITPDAVCEAAAALLAAR